MTHKNRRLSVNALATSQVGDGLHLASCRTVINLLIPFVVLIAISFGLFYGVDLSATSLDEVVKESVHGVREDVASQQKINDFDEETRVLFSQYRAVIRNIETFEIYVKRLRELVTDQGKNIHRREQDIENIQHFERGLFPVIERMIDALDEFIRIDLPFLPGERSNRIARLKDLMPRSDITAAEKFRQLIEAYQVESDYGRTIEAYRGVIDDQEKLVDFLRVGRSLLAYQTLNGEESAVWDAAAWQSLDDIYRADIRLGLRIARKQVAPELLILPFTAPVDLEDMR